MGWLFMRTLGVFATPKEYLDDQFSGVHPKHTTRVLRSAVVKRRAYYAALEVLKADEARQVIAVICLIKYNLRDKEGYIFGYKDMDETHGPYEAHCPPEILDLLTETTNESAVKWRDWCRQNHAQSLAVPKLRDRDAIEFEDAITFADGQTHRRLTVSINPQYPRRIRFHADDRWTKYSISNYRSRAFKVIGRGEKLIETVKPENAAAQLGEGARS